MAQKNLQQAKAGKNDEFYTQLPDIEEELRHYKNHFKGKIVYCNCDDPYESNFFKYFAMKFNYLGLKKLIATSYATSPIAHSKLNLLGQKTSYKIEINKVYDINDDGAEDLADVEQLLKEGKGENKLIPLKGDGDFRSDECIKLLKEADIVVTNPPFSLFREYMAQLIEYKKKFIVLSSMNAITYKEIFPLIKNNEIWTGYGFNLSLVYKTAYPNLLPDNRKFVVSKGYDPDEGYIKVPAITWFTNLDTKKRHESLILYKKYTPEDYPKYDNYDAINVDKITEIPMDYKGMIGVPITFLDKFNPDQFEILGMTTGRKEFDKISHPIKRYINAVQHNPNGTITSGSKANTRATLVINKLDVKSVYYTADNANYPMKICYARILIRHK